MRDRSNRELVCVSKSGNKTGRAYLAKGLGSGVPIGALLVKGKYADILGPGDHGSTFGGNPLAMQAGLTTLDVIEERDFSKMQEIEEIKLSNFKVRAEKLS